MEPEQAPAKEVAPAEDTPELIDQIDLDTAKRMASRRTRLEALFPDPSKSKKPTSKPPTAEEKGKTIAVDASQKPPLGPPRKPGAVVIGGPTATAPPPTKKSAPASTELKRKAGDHPEDRRPPKVVKLGMDCAQHDRMGRGPRGGLKVFSWAECSIPPADVRAMENLQPSELLESSALYAYRVSDLQPLLLSPPAWCA